MLSHNLAEREKQLLQISYHSIRQRVAEALLKLAQPGTKSDFFPIVTIAHKNLASITGAAKETVTRTLAEFKEEGLINMDRMKITIVDEKRLQQITL